MAEECAICKREIGDLEEGPYCWDDGDKLRYMCKACKQRVVEGAKAWLRYQEGEEQDDERARATGERESDDSKDK